MADQHPTRDRCAAAVDHSRASVQRLLDTIAQRKILVIGAVRPEDLHRGGPSLFQGLRFVKYEDQTPFMQWQGIRMSTSVCNAATFLWRSVFSAVARWSCSVAWAS